MITMVKSGRYFGEVIEGPAPDTDMEMYYLDVIDEYPSGGNVERSMERPARKSRFEPHMFLTLISHASDNAIMSSLLAALGLVI